MPIELDISANYNNKGDLVEVEVYPHDNDTYIGDQVTSGYTKLYHISKSEIDEEIDVELASADIDSSLTNDDKRFKLMFNHPATILDLQVKSSVVINNITYNKTVNVLNNIIQSVLSQSEDPLEYEGYPPVVDNTNDSIEQLEQIDVLRLHLNLSLTTPLIKGTGEVGYSGGGNRYLSHTDGNIIEQDLNEKPWEIQCSTFIEEEAENLTTNNDFSNSTGDIPTGYDASSSNLFFTSSVEANSTIDTNEWALRYRLSQWTYPTIYMSNAVAIDHTEPLACSMFLGVFPQLSDNFINLKTVTLKLRFYDITDSILGTKDVDYNAVDLLDDVFLIQNIALVIDYPANTRKVSFEIVLSSFIQGDDTIIKIMLPQLVQSNAVTSFIRNDNTRQKDILTVEQSGNLNTSIGGFVIRFTSGYDGLPTSEKYLFDTRSPSTLQNGFLCKHRVDGVIEFTIDVAGTTYTLVSGSTPFTSSGETEIKVTWDQANDIRKIYYNLNEVASDSGSFGVPGALNSLIYIGSRADSIAQLGCRLAEFFIMRNIY